MSNKQAEQWEKDEIRVSIEEAVQSGATKKRLSDLRKDLAEKYGLTLNQVVAIGAWKIGNGENGLSLEPVKILESTTKEKDSSRDLCEDANCNSDVLIGTTSNVAQENRGAWTNYESSEIKETWRMAEMNFFDEHKEALLKPVEDMWVLCTPGVRCNSEVKHLIDRGIKPEHIIAVEREEAAWEEFESSCREIGILPKFGDLKDVLPDMRSRFDVVLLDFLGQYCVAYQEIVYQLPLSERAMIAINIGGKREHKKIQQVMQRDMNASSGDTAIAIEEKFDQLYRYALDSSNPNISSEEHRCRFTNIWAQANLDVENDMANTDVRINDGLRDLELHNLLAAAGTGRSDNWTFPKMIQKIPMLFAKEDVDKLRRDPFNPDFLTVKNWGHVLDVCERGVFSQLKYTLSGVLGNFGRVIVDKIAPMTDMAMKASTGENLISHLAKYKYLSRVGKIPSPYLTDIAIVERPVDMYRQQQSAVQFIWHVAQEIAKSELRGGRTEFPITIDDGRMSVETEGSNGKLKRITSIQMESLIEAMDLYDQGFEEYPMSKHENTTGIDREILE